MTFASGKEKPRGPPNGFITGALAALTSSIAVVFSYITGKGRVTFASGKEKPSSLPKWFYNRGASYTR